MAARRADRSWPHQHQRGAGAGGQRGLVRPVLHRAGLAGKDLRPKRQGHRQWLSGTGMWPGHRIHVLAHHASRVACPRPGNLRCAAGLGLGRLGAAIGVQKRMLALDCPAKGVVRRHDAGKAGFVRHRLREAPAAAGLPPCRGGSGHSSRPTRSAAGRHASASAPRVIVWAGRHGERCGLPSGRGSSGLHVSRRSSRHRRQAKFP